MLDAEQFAKSQAVEAAKGLLEPHVRRVRQRTDYGSQERSVVDYWEAVHIVTDLLVTLQPRVVHTVEELDALPPDAVVVDFAGCPRTKRGRDSYMPAGWTNAGKSPLRSTELADGHPMKVVYEGRPVPAHRQVWC